MFQLLFVLDWELAIILVRQVATSDAGATRVRFFELGVQNPSPERHLVTDVLGLIASMLMMTGAARTPFFTIHVEVVQIQVTVAEVCSSAVLSQDQLLVMAFETQIVGMVSIAGIKTGGEGLV